MSEYDIATIDIEMDEPMMNDMPEMNTARASHSSYIGGGKLVVFCGFSFRSGPLSSIEMIDVEAYHRN